MLTCFCFFEDICLIYCYTGVVWWTFVNIGFVPLGENAFSLIFKENFIRYGFSYCWSYSAIIVIFFEILEYIFLFSTCCSNPFDLNIKKLTIGNELWQGLLRSVLVPTVKPFSVYGNTEEGGCESRNIKRNS